MSLKSTANRRDSCRSSRRPLERDAFNALHHGDHFYQVLSCTVWSNRLYSKSSHSLWTHHILAYILVNVLAIWQYVDFRVVCVFFDDSEGIWSESLLLCSHGPSTSIWISSIGPLDNQFLGSMGARLVISIKQLMQNTLFSVSNGKFGTDSTTLEASNCHSGFTFPNFLCYDLAMSVWSVRCPPRIKLCHAAQIGSISGILYILSCSSRE